uniref:Uncharacterized protein n=1 Tax=Rhizophora mucronata TaxID=61149 RepID=A0A2P2JX95_RHIMU
MIPSMQELHSKSIAYLFYVDPNNLLGSSTGRISPMFRVKPPPSNIFVLFRRWKCPTTPGFPRLPSTAARSYIFIVNYS